MAQTLLTARARRKCELSLSLSLTSTAASTAWQDDAKEATTTTELLTEAPVEELLAEKREAEEAQRLKSNLSRAATRAAGDPWDELG